MSRRLDIDGAFESDAPEKPAFGEGRVDAVSTGGLRGEPRGAAFEEKEGLASRRQGRRAPISSDDESAEFDALDGGGRRLLSIRAMAAGTFFDELDDSDELQGISGLERSIRRGAQRLGGLASANARKKAAKASADAAKAEKAKGAMRSKLVWKKARELREATVTASAASARTTVSRRLAAAASSAAAPAAGIIGGIICFVLCALIVSQLASALFGFWKNEASRASVVGLPPYVTAEMVEAALECQEAYGHPAGCTLAQIVCESGVGDHLSGLATRDNNLFGIKWAPGFSAAPEVAGKSSWQTGEEYGGQHVTIMADFTSFRSMHDCITFRSRVLLQNSRYKNNPLIKEAIATCSSDKMAEGLKDAGYATSSDYVDSLKSAMGTYNLYRFDSMTVEDWKRGTAGGDAIVAAAYAQLGVPYVWGGSTPGIGLDCSGLVQHCYRQAGIPLPRYSEDQADGGTKVPLSQARPGDILWHPGHVAIYIGGDQYIHEPKTGDVCRISTGISRFRCAVRYR